MGSLSVSVLGAYRGCDTFVHPTDIAYVNLASWKCLEPKLRLCKSFKVTYLKQQFSN